jgi:hypothetical protein
VVFLLDVDGPDVVVGAAGDVLGGEHRGVHRVVLVVVAVHAVAADGMHVGRVLRQPVDDCRHVGFVGLVIERVCLRDPYDVSGFDLVGVYQPKDL